MKKKAKKAPKGSPSSKATVQKQIEKVEKAIEDYMLTVITYASRHPKMLNTVKKPLHTMEKSLRELKAKARGL